MTAKEELSQILDRYEFDSGEYATLKEETDANGCTVEITLHAGEIYKLHQPRERMYKDAPPLLHDELRELAYLGILEMIKE